MYGPRASEYGHVLPLALGFPLETTITITRMILSGVWDRFPKLSILIAHSGGTLPFLAGRIESCIAHDAHMKKEGTAENRRDVWDILKNNVYLDAVIYADVGLKAAVDASGADRLMFGRVHQLWRSSAIQRPADRRLKLGTDHPFFPPLNKNEKEWPSVTLNSKAVRNAFGDDQKSSEALMGANAVRVLRL